MTVTAAELLAEVADATASLDRRAHDVRDRRHTSMEGALNVLGGCIADLETFPGNPGVSYAVAARIARLMGELEVFRARDLLNMREGASR